MKILLCLLLITATLAQAETYQEKVDRAQAAIGQPVDNIPLVTSTGHPVSFTQLEGQPAVIYFFAAWCSSCYSTLRNLESVRNKKMPTLALIAVSLDEDVNEMKAMLKKTGFSGTVWRTEDGHAMFEKMLFANNARALPYAIMLNSEGRLMERSYEITTAAQWAALIEEGTSMKEAELR